MLRIALMTVLPALIASWSCAAFGQEGRTAPGAFLAPAAGQAQAKAALPQPLVQEMLRARPGLFVYDDFAGANASLKLLAEAEAAKGAPLKTGESFLTALPHDALFSSQVMHAGMQVHVGAVSSIGAQALRLKLHIAGLQSGEAVYVVDPAAQRAFGPYTNASGPGDGTVWSSVVLGDTAYVAAAASGEHAPKADVLEIAHLFFPLEEAFGLVQKQAGSCNNHVACESSPAIQQRTRAIGRYVYQSGTSTFICSGALINNPDTETFEPLFLTANHCVGRQSEASSMDVWWDYRAANCNGSGVPSLGSLPRSSGAQLLATSATYDGTLVELGFVPAGEDGRFYLGWTTSAPRVGQDIIGIHHPQGTPMRISYGDVEAVSVDVNVGFDRYQDQIGVSWRDGITEFGSSGSPILESSSLSVLGMLSNGAVHVCPENPNRNTDNYGAFRRFFPQIESFLTSEASTPAPPPSTVSCPAEATFKDFPVLLERLRTFRDAGLAKLPYGQALTDAYYAAAPAAAAMVERSPHAQGLLALVSVPFIQAGALL